MYCQINFIIIVNRIITYAKYISSLLDQFNILLHAIATLKIISHQSLTYIY